MKKNILILAPRNMNEVLRVEKALFAFEFDTLRVITIKDALYRAANEMFSSILCVDSVDSSLQRALTAGLADSPLGAVTPVVVLGEGSGPAERSALTSILDQYFPLSTDPEVIAEFCNETHKLRVEKAKRGTLGTISVPQILNHGARVRMTGSVVVECRDEKCIVFFENGSVVFASSNRDENRFGEFLVAQGVITKDVYSHASRLLRQTGKRFGNILVEEGVIKPQVLKTLIQSQVKHIIYTVFDWIEGEFYILFDDKTGQAEPVAKFDVTSLVLEGIRFRFSEEKLNRIFAPFDQRVSMAISLKEAQRQIQLGKNELDFLKVVGEGRPIGDFLHLKSFSRGESLKLLYAFKVLGLLSFERIARTEPVVDASAKGTDRAQAMNELFRSKIGPLVPETTAPEGIPIPEEAPPVPRRVRYFYSVLGATALSVFVLIVTFVDPRTWRNGNTYETVPLLKPTAVPTAAPTPTEIPTVVVQPTQIPEVLRLVAVASAERNSGELERALATYRKAQRLKPGSIEIAMAIGDVLLDLDRSEEAKAAFEEVVRLEPLNARAYLALGTIHLMQDDKKKAAEALQKYLTLVKRTSQNLSQVTEAQKVLHSIEAEK
ncbi:MAG: DUF4388 domain-containing protein [Pseudomonadota bacterium]